MELIAGQKTKLSDLTTGQNGEEPVQVQVAFDLPDTDISVFGLDDERQLRDDRYMVFFNQPSSPQGEVQVTFAPGAVNFTLRLSALPAAVTRLMFTATHDTRPLRDAGQLALSLGPARFDAVGALQQEKAVMLAELYRHGNEWRLNTVGQGFNGGLAALVTYFGGEVAADEAETPPPSNRTAPAPVAPPADPVPLPVSGPVKLTKNQTVNLSKAGDSSPASPSAWAGNPPRRAAAWTWTRAAWCSTTPGARWTRCGSCISAGRAARCGTPATT
ncbi:tellurium resistance TerZ family protein [Deinococcus radiodurans]|uniref:TerD family protein n=1 Tax=Deinococcus radiodurans TaxID=1299 RepID=UPI00140FE98A|nr:TerD family protein [Deinococcus radiodurans]QIP31208.1 hypothetical protein HAV35_02755 [Deinococcus radiodurans]UTA51542.1 tellurium resistance TerZ family protein [Deinococcus radiodurans]